MALIIFQPALSEKNRNLIQRFSQLKSIFNNCRSETICSFILIKLVSVFIKKMIFIGGEWIGINKRCICYWHNSLISHNPLKKLFKAKELCYSIKKITACYTTILHESGIDQQYFSIQQRCFDTPTHTIAPVRFIRRELLCIRICNNRFVSGIRYLNLTTRKGKQ